jgi:thymidylate synthase
LQRLWFRIIELDGVKQLEMNSHWRSRDAYKAAFMNIYALTDLQRIVAERISKNRNEKVEVGRYADISDSYHIYGFYFDEFERSFLKLVKERTFEKRTWRSDEKTVQYGIKQAHKLLEEERKKEQGA